MIRTINDKRHAQLCNRYWCIALEQRLTLRWGLDKYKVNEVQQLFFALQHVLSNNKSSKRSACMQLAFSETVSVF